MFIGLSLFLNKMIYLSDIIINVILNLSRLFGKWVLSIITGRPFFLVERLNFLWRKRLSVLFQSLCLLLDGLLVLCDDLLSLLLLLFLLLLPPLDVTYSVLQRLLEELCDDSQTNVVLENLFEIQ